MRLVLVLVAALGLPACSNHCTDQAVFGIVVRLTAQTGGAAITGADVEAVEGSYVEKLVDNGDGTYDGATERAGTYTVTINASGYMPLTVQPVEVKPGDCHVVTKTVDVQLTAK
jgi:hypothetical protein